MNPQKPHNIPEHNILDLRRTVHIEKVEPEALEVVQKKEPAQNRAMRKRKPAPVGRSFLPGDQFTKKKSRLSIFAQTPVIIRIRALKGIIIGSLVVIAIFSTFSFYQSAKATQASVVESSQSGMEALRNAEQALRANDRETVRDSLQTAEQSFRRASQSLESAKKKFGILLQLPFVHDDLTSGEQLLSIGSTITQLGLHIDQLAQRAEVDGDVSGFVSFFAAYQEYGDDVHQDVQTLHQQLSELDATSLPEEYQSDVASLSQRFFSLYDTLERIDTLASIFSDVLGFSGQRDYLLIFQNNQELRATGGFIGSVAQVSLDEGAIRKLTVPEGGSYDISGQNAKQYRAPKPLQIVNPYFTFQDANWFPDFPASAQKILNFYYEAGGDEVDGIISLTPDVILSFLDLTGPVTLDEYQETISTENFLRFTREEIEKKKDEGSNKPKKIIADLMPVLIERLFSLSPLQQIDVALSLNDALQTKDILLFATDASLQDRILSAGLAGEQRVLDTDDVLSIIDTNIAGGKTNRYIAQHLLVSTDLRGDQVHNTVVVTREHAGIQSDEFSGVTNMSYMRLYVPNGSVLEQADGFYPIPSSWYQLPPAGTAFDPDLEISEQTSVVSELSGTRITEENGFTAFGNWMRVEAGASTASTVSYALPEASEASEWSLYVRKQPGMLQSYVTWVVESDQEISDVVSSAVISKKIHGKTAEVSFVLDQDTILGVILKH